MLKLPHGRECKICERPFTVFRWKAGNEGARHKMTEICRTCAKVKNACQTCVLDLRFGVPIAVRDAAMNKGGDVAGRGVVVTGRPTSEVGREYVASVNQRKVEKGDYENVFEGEIPKEGRFIKGLSRNDKPKYERNKAKICSFFVKGQCTRGIYCPYRHEMPETPKESPFAKQNIKDRYYGVNDPVANAMLKGVREESRKRGRSELRQGRGGDDGSVKTVFIGGLNVEVPVKEAELRLRFEKFGKVENIKVIKDKGIAFVELAERDDARAAMDGLRGMLEIGGNNCRVNWARGAHNNVKRRKVEQ